MSQFSGRQAAVSGAGRNKGVMRARRQAKRDAAIARNLLTVHDRRKAHRLGRCTCGPTDQSESRKAKPRKKRNKG